MLASSGWRVASGARQSLKTGLEWGVSSQTWGVFECRKRELRCRRLVSSLPFLSGGAACGAREAWREVEPSFFIRVVCDCWS